ncbi:GroES-like protein [Hypoxylon sp. FL1284]|nr:GroES-like protein [Hypoxylon sp. FL1284]
MTADLPAEHRGLVIDDGISVKTLPVPQPEIGSAVIRIEAAGVLSYHREIYGGERKYSFARPAVGGVSAIGRVAAVAADATALRAGQLVYVDCTIRARDNPGAVILTAIYDGETEDSRRLMRDVWRDGYMAQYARAPLENVFALDEARLCRGLGYTVPELMYMCYLVVPFGGLRDVRLEPGETVVVCPATGGYGGAGVQVAVAMGARVVAMGRNEAELARLRAHVLRGTPNASVETVGITGDEAADAAAIRPFGPVDAVLDLSSPAAAKGSHVRAAVRNLRRGGRVSLMGRTENPMVPSVTERNISLRGKFMYERDDVLLFIKMLESGLFPRGKDFVDVKAYKLDDWKEAFDVAAEFAGIGKYVTLVL